jgi:hypothetical protein
MAKAQFADNGEFFWNLSSEVGQGKANRADDVELVRYGYYCMGKAKDNQARLTPSFGAALAGMSTRGGFDKDLDLVIREHQKLRGGIQDGIVSVARPTKVNHGRYDLKHTWIVITLNLCFSDMIGVIYPRIDLNSESGPSISEVVRKTFQGL